MKQIVALVKKKTNESMVFFYLFLSIGSLLWNNKYIPMIKFFFILYIFIKAVTVNLTYGEVVLPLCQLIWSKIIQYLVSPSISFKLCKMWFSTCELVILFNLLWIAPALPAL